MERDKTEYKFIVGILCSKKGVCKVGMGRPGGGGEERWEK
jgi:hypothetical protein